LPTVRAPASTIPDLERQIAIQENQINLLLGRNPGPIPRGTVLTEQYYPPSIPAGLPSALLERRPDVKGAEDLLVAANANIGAAKALFFPNFSLTSSLGGATRDLSNLVDRNAPPFGRLPAARFSRFSRVGGFSITTRQ
jgi:multidrug efflux system outer membrane protein